jgi:ATP-dependent DNA helicase RecG
MVINSDQLQQLLIAKEDEHLEFKEAKNNFHFEKLVKYCAALANEGGGSIVLGVTDSPPRRVVGSRAFADLERSKAGLVERLHLRIEASEIQHPDGRVLVFTAPSRPIGVPIAIEGAYWMRAGEDLAPMTPDMLRRIFDEAGPDFSAEICPKAELSHLDPAAIEALRERWRAKSKNETLRNIPPEQLLRDAELITTDGVTYAALILLGSREALGQFLAQSEVIFEYRSSEAAGPANQRDEYRHGFLLFYDKLWETINLRNDQQHYQDTFVMYDIPTFNEGSVREAILNAVSHRDYLLPGSVFVRQYARRIEIVSPGGFPSGITPENILDKQSPRNRRVAETLLRCGLIERSGQGANRMFEESIRHSKPLPNYSRSDAFDVFLTLQGEIQDPAFLRFLTKVEPQLPAALTTHDYLVLDLVRREQPIPSEFRDVLQSLREAGFVESQGRGRGTRYFLSRTFYDTSGQKGVYTRKVGLDRETNKALLLKHIDENRQDGSPLFDLQQVLPFLSRDQVQTLLKELKADHKIHNIGRTKGGRWYLGKGAE